MGYRFLITGADFRNKGGQSMLFITVDELKSRFPDCEIYYPTNQDPDKNFAVKTVYYDYNSLLYLNGGKDRLTAVCKGIMKWMLGKKGNVCQIRELKGLFPTLDAVVDVSGFNLSSKWPMKTNKKYLLYIKTAKKYGIPSFIMPQSFGPFSYGKKQRLMDSKIREIMSYPSVIFAREHEGEELLKNRYHLKNIRYSCDLVLQNKGINENNVFFVPPVVHIPEVKKPNAAVIPNMRSFEKGDMEKILGCYRLIINELLNYHKTVYIFRHATEDMEACRWIKNLFESEERVILLEEDFSCLEYDQFVKEFDYVIASRFHAIVHALRRGVPALALGWAVKYNELLQLFGLDDFVFNITENVDSKSLKQAIEYMETNKGQLEELILSKIKVIQQKNCFDSISQYLQ